MRWALVALPLVLAACASAPAPIWAERAAQAHEAGVWAASETALLVVPGNLDPGASPEATALAAAGAATDPFDPNECVVATADGASVTYVLDDCVGSFGLVRATGRMLVTYVASADGRTTFHASATDLVLNGGAVSFEAEAAVLHDAALGERTIELTIDTHGIGPSGSSFTRQGTQTARWSDTWGCLFVDAGSDTLSVDGLSWDTRTNNLSYCVGECATPGGGLIWRGTAGALDVQYNGTPAARWFAGDPSEMGTVPVTCGF